MLYQRLVGKGYHFTLDSIFQLGNSASDDPVTYFYEGDCGTETKNSNCISCHLVV